MQTDKSIICLTACFAGKGNRGPVLRGFIICESPKKANGAVLFTQPGSKLSSNVNEIDVDTLPMPIRLQMKGEMEKQCRDDTTAWPSTALSSA